MADHLKELNVISLLGGEASAAAMAEFLVAAARAALFQLPKITDKPSEPANLNSIRFLGNFKGADFAHDEATAEGNNLARWLTHLPGNYLTPGIYRDYAETPARREGWEAQFYDRDKLEELGAGCLSCPHPPSV